MYGTSFTAPYCPFCGYNKQPTREPEEAPTDDSYVKTERVIEYEDNLTESYCKNGGWYNPITKECMGEGNGFIPRNT
jgi:hypothetical protein